MLKQLYRSIHLIAIGGSAMHNLALALHNMGIKVTGSDDKIFEPSRSRLGAKGLLPDSEGWNPDRITEDTDLVILGMHAKEDNPELKKAQELGLKIVSMPEFIFELSENKQRIVIAGSHGKTSVTAMIMHVLKHAKKDFDYFIGAIVPDFDVMVRLSDAPVIIIEGDEYLSSTLDRKPKFLNYHHHIGVINGIAWDHANVFPDKEIYEKQFKAFAELTPKAGTLIYNSEDPKAKVIGSEDLEDVANIPFGTHPHKVRNGKTILTTEFGEIEVQFFGEHNMRNLGAAKEVCRQLCITDLDFYEAVRSFQPADRRLELVSSTETGNVYRDFAHAPSKVLATLKALKNQFPDRKLVGILELHTFSSLNKGFISEYAHTVDEADEVIVFLNKEVVEAKGKDVFTEADIQKAFDREDIQVTYTTEELKNQTEALSRENTDIVFMSSGNFGGLAIN